MAVTTCGGGGGSSGDGSLVLTIAAVKTFHFSWTDVSGATHYKLLENPDGVSGFTQVGADITQGTQSVDYIVPLYSRIKAQYMLQSCNSSGCSDSSTVSVTGALVAAIGYAKASNTGANDLFGYAICLAADGNTLAVGANGERSSATGVTGDQSDNSAIYAGAVYVFTRNGSTWSQQAYLKASNTGEDDNFGNSVSLTADGNTLAVGAFGEASSVIGDPSDNSALGAGAVYVFARSSGTWSQQAYLKASNTGANDEFGYAVNLAAGGSTLAVGAWGEDSNATGVDGNQSDNSASNAGAVYVFTRSGSTWSQQAYLKASNAGANDAFGFAVNLTADGNTLAVGAPIEASSIASDPSDNSMLGAGAVYVFTRSSGTWSQQAYLKASNIGANDEFGYVVNLSTDGSTLAVGAWSEDSNATGVDGNQSDNSASDAGAVYVFTHSGSTWSQQAYLKASNAEAGDAFGRGLSLAADGNTLAVGANGERSSATGVTGDQSDNSAIYAGAVYVFTRSGSTWSQQAYIKASNTGANDGFGRDVSLAADGNTLAVGAYTEDSSATGVDGNQSDNSASNGGAVYLY